MKSGFKFSKFKVETPYQGESPFLGVLPSCFLSNMLSEYKWKHAQHPSCKERLYRSSLLASAEPAHSYLWRVGLHSCSCCPWTKSWAEVMISVCLTPSSSWLQTPLSAWTVSASCWVLPPVWHEELWTTVVSGALAAWSPQASIYFPTLPQGTLWGVCSLLFLELMEWICHILNVFYLVFPAFHMHLPAHFPDSTGGPQLPYNLVLLHSPLDYPLGFDLLPARRLNSFLHPVILWDDKLLIFGNSNHLFSLSLSKNPAPTKWKSQFSQLLSLNMLQESILDVKSWPANAAFWCPPDGMDASVSIAGGRANRSAEAICSSLAAAVTNCHKLRGLKYHKCIFLQFRR